MSGLANMSRHELAIDACVGREASTANVPRSRESRDVLISIYDNKSLVIAISPNLEVEWRNHAVPFAMKWYANMVSRNRVRQVKDRVSVILRDHVRQCRSEER